MEFQNGCTKAKNDTVQTRYARASDALKNPTYVENPDSGELHRPHHIDLKSGMYRGRQVIEPKD